MKDQANPDEKILTVPVDEPHLFYAGVRCHADLPVILCDQIAHFFSHDKDLEKDKWTDIGEWIGTEAAERLIVDAIARAASAR